MPSIDTKPECPFARRMRLYDSLPREFRDLFKEYGAHPGPTLAQAIMQGRVSLSALHHYLEQRSKE